MDSINSASFLSALPVSQFARYLPEPRSRVAQTVANVLSAAGSVVSYGVGQFAGLDPTYMDLLNKQVEMQQQMQLVSLQSNIEKSKHETQMAAIRNVRVG